MKISLNRNHEGFFGKTQTTVLKGVCILLVFIHHFAQFTEYHRFFSFFNAIGPAAVDIFFFIAGYTTILKLEKTAPSDYNSFLPNRALRLYFPFILINITNDNFTVGLIFLYIASWIAYKFLKPQHRLKFIFLMNMFYIILLLFIKQYDSWWYDRIIPYSYGAFFALHKNKVISFLENPKWRRSLMIISIPIFIFCGYHLATMEPIVPVKFALLSIFTCVFVLTFNYEFNFECKSLNFIGEISFEIFLLHQPLFNLLNTFIGSNYLLLIVSFVLTIILSYCLHLVWNKLIKRFIK